MILLKQYSPTAPPDGLEDLQSPLLGDHGRGQIIDLTSHLATHLIVIPITIHPLSNPTMVLLDPSLMGLHVTLHIGQSILELSRMEFHMLPQPRSGVSNLLYAPRERASHGRRETRQRTQTTRATSSPSAGTGLARPTDHEAPEPSSHPEVTDSRWNHYGREYFVVPSNEWVSQTWVDENVQKSLTRHSINERVRQRTQRSSDAH